MPFAWRKRSYVCSVRRTRLATQHASSSCGTPPPASSWSSGWPPPPPSSARSKTLSRSQRCTLCWCRSAPTDGASWPPPGSSYVWSGSSMVSWTGAASTWGGEQRAGRRGRRSAPSTSTDWRGRCRRAARCSRLPRTRGRAHSNAHSAPDPLLTCEVPAERPARTRHRCPIFCSWNGQP